MPGIASVLSHLVPAEKVCRFLALLLKILAYFKQPSETVWSFELDQWHQYKKLWGLVVCWSYRNFLVCDSETRKSWRVQVGDIVSSDSPPGWHQVPPAAWPASESAKLQNQSDFYFRWQVAWSGHWLRCYHQSSNKSLHFQVRFRINKQNFNKWLEQRKTDWNLDFF